MLKLCTHIWACTHSASVCLLVPHLFFTLRGTVTQPRSQSARGLSHSHIHGYTQHKHTAATVCIYREGFECKCSQRSSPTNICGAVSEQRRCLNSVSSKEEEENEGGGEAQLLSDVSCVFCCVFRMGGIPAKTHKEEKLLIYLGIIDILQSYRYC